MPAPDFAPEKHFVSSFVRKARSDRIMHELTTPAKRYDGLDRFCHQTPDLLDMSKVFLQGDDLERLPAFKSFVASHNGPCVLLSPDSFVDGEVLPLKEAVEKAIMSMDAVIVLGSTFAVVFGEVMKTRDKFLLVE